MAPRSRAPRRAAPCRKHRTEPHSAKQCGTVPNSAKQCQAVPHSACSACSEKNWPKIFAAPTARRTEEPSGRQVTTAVRTAFMSGPTLRRPAVHPGGPEPQVRTVRSGCERSRVGATDPARDQATIRTRKRRNKAKNFPRAKSPNSAKQCQTVRAVRAVPLKGPKIFAAHTARHEASTCRVVQLGAGSAVQCRNAPRGATGSVQ